MTRIDGRAADQLRSITIVPGVFEYAPGSALFQLGKTKVLCAVTISPTVPGFLKGKGTGWLTAEYSLLPASTPMRSARESYVVRNGRSTEISRLIGRVLRSVVDLTVLNEYTITVDCDVLQADGGTRCASICGAQVALDMAVKHWRASGFLTQPLIKNRLAAVSVGVSAQAEVLLDLNAQEDAAIAGDFNFVLTSDSSIVEIQGTGETAGVAWHQFDRMRELAIAGTAQIFASYDRT